MAPERNIQQRSYVMIKPDGVHRGLVGTVIQRFENRGYKLIALKMYLFSHAHARITLSWNVEDLGLWTRCALYEGDSSTRESLGNARDSIGANMQRRTRLAATPHGIA